MGFWDVFKPVAKIGAAVAAPITGGASLMALPALEALGGGASSAAESMAQNRGANVGIEQEILRRRQDQERMFYDAILRREQERREGGDAAWKKLQQASYISNWAPRAPLSPYTRSLQRPADDITAMARNPEMWAVLSSRAAYQDPFEGQLPSPTLDTSGVDKYRKSSIWEKLLGAGGAAASIYGAASAPREKK